MSTHPLLLTCEHAGNYVPKAYREPLHDAAPLLVGHRGWDIGSLALARTFRSQFAAPLYYTRVTRLLIDLNRTEGHRHLFSEFSKQLTPTARQQVLQRYYFPHRRRVEAWLTEQLRENECVIHVSFHTFTPQLDGKVRNADIGLLYDPRRPREATLCRQWHHLLQTDAPKLRIRRNYPYRGVDDGLTTFLRRRLGSGYIGIELEVNQLWPLRVQTEWRWLRRKLATTFHASWHVLDAPLCPRH